MSKNALLIAYHFPPFQGSSGVHRTLGFSRYLVEHGWNASVLTTTTSAYPRSEVSNYESIPEHVDVIRAPALDAARHLAVAGRYPAWLARPDRWQSWIVTGVARGLLSSQARRADVIFSTFPIASAHVIAHALHRMLGVPWVADFRDPMVMPSYPEEAATRRSWTKIERQVAASASRITVTTEGTAEQYRKRYPSLGADRVSVIPNGFDEELFAGLAAQVPAGHDPARRITLLHSGALYPQNRNPEPFLQALNRLITRGIVDPLRIEVVLRASGSEPRYREIIARLKLQEVVRLEPSLPYAQALAEMARADALLIFQGPDFNRQVPAKVYEYLFVDRPILALAEDEGDTARLLRRYGVPGIAPLNDVPAIEAMLSANLPQVIDGTYPRVARSEVQKLSRRARAGELAAVFDAVSAGSGVSR